MTTLYITADRKRFVPAGDPDAAFGVAEVDVDRLGLRDAYEEFLAPPVAKAPPPKPKQLPKPSNKMVRRHTDK